MGPGVSPRGRLPALFLGVTLFALAVLAHQPRLVGDTPLIEVANPEISQAFYARLTGRPQTYRIASSGPLHLYLNILVPDLPRIDTDYRAVVYRSTESPENVIGVLEGRDFEWKPFFEPFGGDHYLLGPEFERDVAAGTYIVVVSSPDKTGRYALAVGKEESFPAGEIIRTIVVLPRLKKEFFGKSPLTAFFNLSGVFLLIILVVVAGLVALVLVLRRRRKRRAVP